MLSKIRFLPTPEDIPRIDIRTRPMNLLQIRMMAIVHRAFTRRDDSKFPFQCLQLLAQWDKHITPNLSLPSNFYVGNSAKQIAEAIAMEPDIKGLILDNFGPEKLNVFLSTIFSSSNSICRITIENYVDAPPDPFHLRATEKSKITEINFRNCAPNLIFGVLNGLKEFEGHIKTLCIGRSKLTSQHFQMLYKCLNEVSCFSTLIHLKLEEGTADMINIQELSEFLSTFKLRSLTLSRASIDISTICSSILPSTKSLKQLYLTSGRFFDQVNPDIIFPESLNYIDLSKVEINIEALSSLLKALFSKPRKHPIALNLSELATSGSPDDTLKCFDIKNPLPILTEFNYCGNELTPETSELLYNFLRTQKYLRYLNLSRCFNKRIDECLKRLSNFIIETKLSCLELSCGSSNPLKESAVQFFNDLKGKSQLTTLTMERTQMGDKGLLSFLEFMQSNPKLSSVGIDGALPTSPQVFEKVYNSFVSLERFTSPRLYDYPKFKKEVNLSKELSKKQNQKTLLARLNEYDLIDISVGAEHKEPMELMMKFMNNLTNDVLNNKNQLVKKNNLLKVFEESIKPTNISLKADNDIQNNSLAENPEQEKFRIRSEMADLRSLIKDYDPSLMPRVVAKLLFLHIIGENVSFGQLEPLTLMTNERFSYKRLGYIACAVMIDENSELSVLLTQTVRNDLQSTDRNIQCLALSLIANIGSSLTCQTVVPEVIKIFNSKNSRVLRCAAMAAIRIIQKLPEHAESFKPLIGKLLKNGSHGVVIAGICLMEALVRSCPNFRSFFCRYCSPFTKILKQLNRSKASKEFSYNFFNDPFLQMRLLSILSFLNKKSDDLDTVLESIITGADTKKNTGRALLFQAVMAVVTTANKPSLRGLAFSQVGRLFKLKDPNVIYSALSIFSRVLYSGNEIIGRTSGDSVALQRYKSQIVRCLNNGDPSIRRRALDVISALVDENNVETLIPEVLDYVKLADKEFRVELVSKIYAAIQRFSPNPEWNFSTVHLLLIEHGNYVGNDLVVSFCKLISKTPEMQKNAVQQLAGSMTNFSDNQTLVQVSAYVIGEFMDQFENDIFELMKKIIMQPQTTTITKSMLITSLAKLAVRFDKKTEIRNFLKQLIPSEDLEVQQRAGEMYEILGFKDFSEDILAPLDRNEENAGNVQKNNVVVDDKDEVDLLDLFSTTETKNDEQHQTQKVSLLDELTDFDVKTTPEPIQKVEIKPPQGAIEGLRKPDYVIYFEIIKNPQNPKQIALRASIFNLGTMPLTNFNVKYGAPVGWFIQTQPPSSTTLEAIGGRPILQQLMVYTQSDVPLLMKVQVSYNYGSQPIVETGEVNNIFN
ncbi:Adaptin N terminal region family protein [Histomonas meleagridis]|uniref:Adaptin N terminal region family protein n=1 Tax=Histomonas meleagridis TaxID=135588 RepID=UPI00355ABB9D|nr:Adaptin N terminal region family protein [Histomonas meleagridis]KAH0804296.1 Adaptin N terminal region family protein [Histomonas meleagridis]